MSDDFGKNVKAPPPKVDTHADIKAMYPEYAHLANANYNRHLKEYFACVTKYLNDFYDPEVLQN